MKGYNRLWAPMRKSLNLSVQSSPDVVSLGSFSNDDGDVNANDKKTIGLDWPNNNFARASSFLHISLPSLLDYDVKIPKFHDLWRTWTQDNDQERVIGLQRLCFSSLELRYSLLDFNSRKKWQHLTN